MFRTAFECILKIYLFWKNYQINFFNYFNILILKIKKIFWSRKFVQITLRTINNHDTTKITKEKTLINKLNFLLSCFF